MKNIFLEKSHTKYDGEASPRSFKKIKIEHICGSTVWNVIQFIFIACTSRDLPKYITVDSLYLECSISPILLYLEQLAWSLGHLALN